MATCSLSPPSCGARTSPEVRRKRWNPELESPPIRLEIIDVEKRKGLSNYYAYIIIVTRSDGSKYIIHRRYSQFHEMHSHLEDRFPIEAGAISAKDRTLPSLPGKIFFGRSAVRDVTDKRLPHLNSYLKTLFELPDKIRYDSIVMAFVRPTSEDKKAQLGKQSSLNGTANGPGIGTTSGKNSRSKPDRPPRPSVAPSAPSPRAQRPTFPPPLPHTLAQKSKPALTVPPSRQGPATPPKPPVKPRGGRGPRAKTLYAYTKQYSDELSFPEGVVLSLVRRVDEAWYEAQLEGQSGLVPRTYLDVIEPPVTRDTKDDRQESDEWEDDSDGEKGKISYYFNGAARTLEVSLDLVEEPILLRLKEAIQAHLGQRDIVLNYKDSSGDLVEMADQNDIALMRKEGIPPRRRSDSSTHAPWAIYVTKAGNHTPYHTDPYQS